ncbi:hypothetical protein PAXRUDRAFT_825067 [Paxillus rubicundulus Ve08.2h10]|uniref:F-box domain-containing protein n=1 Tax=Paxillus rubicundulus Ve08.2h10 TaxID=930991 RepID=A0A0D0DGX7_9AGAM|nr:hypothetical protein PAXRUDRAFT_825067 [Paxillus rubicundulus Ve08.2h10]
MNVNLDVLELIFAHLEGSDLVSSSLVSRSFLAGVIPSLYSRIEYTSKHSKRFSEIISPFATVSTHKHLSVHVKRIAVHSAPALQPSSLPINPIFLKDLAQAVCVASNLRSFTCTVNILPPLLPHLKDKPRLQHLRVYAPPIGSRQMNVLQEVRALQSLSLDFPTCNVIDAMSKWVGGMQNTLTHLTIFMSQDIDASVLDNTLAQLHRLRGLHVIGCSRVTHTVVLKALSHTPDLRELSFTIFPTQETSLPPLTYPMPLLTHLSLDIRASHPALQSLIARLVSRLAPRDALAICGAWIGEIKSGSERNATGGEGDHPGGGAGGAGGAFAPFGPNFHVVHHHGHMHGHGPGHGQGNEPPPLPLLTAPALVGPNQHPDANPGPNIPPADPVTNPPNPNPVPGFNIFGFPFTFLPNNPNPVPAPDPNLPHPVPADPHPDPDPHAPPTLVASLPPTLTSLHLPQLSPAALTDIVKRCEELGVLGMATGSGFSSSPSARRGGVGVVGGVGRERAGTGVKQEIRTLADILSGAKELREIILDTSGSLDRASATASGAGIGGGADVDAEGGAGARILNGSRGMGRGGQRSGALLTSAAVRMLMKEAPMLRRVVGEGRVWESSDPNSTSTPHFLRGNPVNLTLSKSRPAPGVGGHHTHGPPGFGGHGGHGQVEVGNEHWFWLADGGMGIRV